MANERIDEETGVEFVGHEWDGIEELNNPLPRWWIWTFYITIFWAVAYCIAYPAWPLIEKGTEGMLGWTSRGQLAGELAKQEQERAATVAGLADLPIEQLQGNPQLMSAAVAGGAAAYKVNCVQCHGAGAGGIQGQYPNLSDDDWLWGGDIKAIEQTIVHGIRHPGDRQTRFSEMPAFGRDGLLTPAQIDAVAGHVLSLSGKAKANAAGAQVYANDCALCHGEDGKGMRDQGAPDLTDAIWLYGSKPGSITRTELADIIANARNSVMPAWGERLDSVTIRMLAAYVHSLGGGEDFTEGAGDGAETPAAAGNEQS